MSVKIRQANDTDIEWLSVQLKAFSDFNASKIPLYKKEYASDFITNMIKGHLCLIAYKDEDTRMGFISGMITNHIYNPEIKMLVEMFWWVDPSYRASRAGLMLLNYFTEMGKDYADWIIFTLEHHSPVNEKSLIKRGFKLRERNYLLEVR